MPLHESGLVEPDFVFLPLLVATTLIGFWLGLVRALSFALPPLAALCIGYLFREQISPFFDVVFGSISNTQDASLGGNALFVFIALSAAIGYSVFWLTRNMVCVFSMAYPNMFMRVAGGALTLTLFQLLNRSRDRRRRLSGAGAAKA